MSPSSDERSLWRLRDVLDDVGSRFGTSARDSGAIWRHWRDVVGSPIAENAQPTSLRAGVLRVRVTSPTWATEIGYLSEDIRKRLNAAIGREAVARVKVWTGPGPLRDPSPAPAREEPDPGARVGPERPPSADPLEAYVRARRAWEKWRRRGG